MDFTSDFNIPTPQSQLIESDSDEPVCDKSIKESCGSQDQSESSSPVFRKYRTSSPVFSHGKKRSSSPVVETHKVARRSLNLDFFKRLEGDEETLISTGEDEFSSFESGEAVAETLSLASSQAVSSCQSSIGARPQPIEDPGRLVAVTASTLLGELTEDDEVFETGDITPDILNSGKKKKSVKGGMAEQLEKILQQKSSREHLEKYQTELGNSDGEVTMVIVDVNQDDDNFILQGKNYGVIMNTDFCPDMPEKGDTVSFYHPKAHRYIDGKKVFFGVFKIKIISKSPEDEKDDDVTKQTTESNLKCLCLCGGICRGSENFHLPNYFGDILDKSHSLSTSDDSLRSIPSSPSNNLHKVPVSKLVEILGGTSSSPQNSFRLYRKIKFSSDLLIHRIFFQKATHREDNCQLYSFTILCQDTSGEFVLVKIDSSLINDVNWKFMFENWEAMIGQRIALWSPFHIQNRYTRAQNIPLFTTISSICETNQRFCYVFKAFPGSRFDTDTEAEERGIIKIVDCLPVKSDNHQRVNLKATVIYTSSDKSVLYILQASDPSSYRLITAGTSFVHDKFFRVDSRPCQCVIVGLLQKPCGSLSLDGFSSIIRIKKTVIDLSFLPVRASASKVGDLVRIEGMVTRVNQQASLQWMECDTCGSDEVEEEPGAGAGWRCLRCNTGTEARHRMELVCRVDSWWARLGKSANMLLPNDKLKSFHPADVIGQVTLLILSSTSYIC